MSLCSFAFVNPMDRRFPNETSVPVDFSLAFEMRSRRVKSRTSEMGVSISDSDLFTKRMLDLPQMGRDLHRSGLVATQKGRLQHDSSSPLGGGRTSPPPPPIGQEFFPDRSPGAPAGGLSSLILPVEFRLEYRGWQIQYFRITPIVDGQPLFGSMLVNWIIQTPQRVLVERSRSYDRNHRLEQFIRWVFTQWEIVRRLMSTAGLPFSVFKESMEDRLTVVTKTKNALEERGMVTHVWSDSNYEG